MSRLTASDIVRAISHLPRNQDYHYIDRQTKTRILILDVVLPEGPIVIGRYDPSKRQRRREAKKANISSPMIWRVANALSEGVPINMDRVLGGSYNTRSALEALLAHTPQFYYCYPGRIEATTSSSLIKSGHKHLMWLPDEPHKQGLLVKKATSKVISEIPTAEAVYEALVLPEGKIEPGMDIEIERRHAQIQIALVEIGRQLQFRTWVAQNDKGIIYNDQRLGEMDGVIARLDDVRLLASFEEARRAAQLIDCIWFQNAKLMPAVIEIEHSTSITSGLTRLKEFQDALPALLTRWVIAAPDEDRERVMRACNRKQFKSLNARYFPYSGIEELYYLCQKRKLRGVTEEFLDCFMERSLPRLREA